MVLWMLACMEPVSELDRAWLLDVIYADNWRYLGRDPEALAEKFSAMAQNEYDFMRGTLSIQLAHWSRQAGGDGARQSTRFLNTPESTMVPIFGDAHPENLTVCAHPAQQLTIEIVDLDGANYGPWWIDVRRALTAQRTFAKSFEGCDEDCQLDVASAWLDGFESGLQGAEVEFQRSALLQSLLEEAIEEGLERKKYSKYTVDDKLIFDEAVNAEGKALLPVGNRDRLSREIFEGFSVQWGDNIRLLDIGQRVGMGVSSRPALRYVYLWDEGMEGPEDNHLMLAREVFDAPDYPGAVGLDYAPFESNAERVSTLREQLWHNAGADPLYRGVDVPYSFKTQSWSSYFQDVEFEKVREDWLNGEIDAIDVQDLAMVMGAHHAFIWGRATVFDGRSVQAVVNEDIQMGGGFDILREELVEMSAVDVTVQSQDFVWFVDVLERRGPLLGFDVLRAW